MRTGHQKCYLDMITYLKAYNVGAPQTPCCYLPTAIRNCYFPSSRNSLKKVTSLHKCMLT